jgi:uncharacterized membrane protein (DUF485 family)
VDRIQTLREVSTDLGAFMANEAVEELLRQAIAASDRTTAASNRTTFAIRAFVLFLFLQLAFTTIAAFFIWLGYTSYNGFGWVVVGIAIFVLGVIVSSTVGWWEIGMSGVGLDYPDKEKPMIYEYQTSQTQKKKYPESPGYSKAKPRTTSSEDSEGRVCTECVKYTTKVECEHCGERER